MLKNGLYIVSTPIGNLKDISERAISVLEDVSIIACEDTRVTKKLFSLLGISISRKFISYQDYSEEDKSQTIIDLINNGESVALVSDAGSPLISDPGYKVVKKCREQDIYVTVIPGACAVISALQLSGLPTNRFMFVGFIPNKDKARKDLFEELKFIDTTLVFYETAPRLLKSLVQAKEIFINREIAVAREITKMYEEVVVGEVDKVIKHFEDVEPKGEFVLMIAPPVVSNYSLDDVRDILLNKMKNMSLKSAVKEVCEKYSLNKNEVYALALELKNE